MSDQLKVFIAEDEQLIRDSLQAAIQSEPDMNVVGSADNGLEALRLIPLLQPDLVLMDIQMPGLNGIACINKLRAARYEGTILILTAYQDEQYVIKGLMNGANGYLLKVPNIRSMLQTIRVAMNGQYVLPAEMTARLVRYISEKDSSTKEGALDSFAAKHSLSQREKEILPLLLKRLSNKEIAELLHVSEGTVKNYLTVLYDKLGVKNRQVVLQHLMQHLQ